jgi:hypothetical protein
MQSVVSLTGWRAHQWVSLFQFPTYFASKQFNVWISMKSMKRLLFYSKCFYISFFQIFNFLGSSVIFLSLSEIPIWTHQRQFGLILSYPSHSWIGKEEWDIFTLAAVLTLSYLSYCWTGGEIVGYVYRDGSLTLSYLSHGWIVELEEKDRDIFTLAEA